MFYCWVCFTAELAYFYYKFILLYFNCLLLNMCSINFNREDNIVSFSNFINSQRWHLMIHNIKQHFSNKFFYDRIVEYSIVRIHVCNWNHFESNTSMHGVKYKVISVCIRLNVLDDSFVLSPRFCIIVQKCHKFLKYSGMPKKSKYSPRRLLSMYIVTQCSPSLWFGSVCRRTTMS